MSLTGIENGRASFAFSCAREGSELKAVNKEYKAYVRKIPALIRTNGLGATMAFLAAKKDQDPSKKGYAYLKVYQQIGDWLARKGLIHADQGPLEKQVIEMDSLAYRVTTAEVLALFRWLTRFAEALIEGETNE